MPRYLKLDTNSEVFCRVENCTGLGDFSLVHISYGGGGGGTNSKVPNSVIFFFYTGICEMKFQL